METLINGLLQPLFSIRAYFDSPGAELVNRGLFHFSHTDITEILLKRQNCVPPKLSSDVPTVWP